MKYEKSCGAVVYRVNNKNKPEYLIIFNKKGKAAGHWGFPKGHIEDRESEVQTAEREILEETGIKVQIDTQFRMVSRYSPKPGVEKDAVYFAAKATDADVVLQQSEVADFLWCEYDEAVNRLTHDADILNGADEYIRKNIF